MEKRRELLIVLSISTILVLAGFAANEKAYAGGPNFPPFGDFTCWINIPATALTTEFPISIVDQFGTVANDIWTQQEYCAATEKNGEVSPFSFTFGTPLRQHYQGWLYPPEFQGDAIGTTVLLEVPQFQHNFQTTILAYDQILVPADKVLMSEDTVLTTDKQQHWNCYEISGQAPETSTVDLKTQHGDIFTTTILEPVLMCAPMNKEVQFNGYETFELLDIFDGNNHMVCYDIIAGDDQSTNLPELLADQITFDQFVDFFIDFSSQEHIDGLEKLCVPAIKSFPIVGGFNVPIDTSALLLAGVQSISMWMIPVVIAGVGIGIFVIKRRK